MDINSFLQNMYLMSSYQMITPFAYTPAQSSIETQSPAQKKYSRIWHKQDVQEVFNKTLEYCQYSNKQIKDLILSDFQKIGKNCSQTPEQIMIKMNEVNQSGTLRPGIWSNNEDELLRTLIERKERWGKIANLLNTEIHKKLKIRSGKQCKERWNNYLNPSINRGPWTTEEDIEILKRYRMHGKKWSVIARDLQNRTESAVKNRVKSLLNKIKQDLSSIDNIDSGILDYINRNMGKELLSSNNSNLDE